MWVTMLPRLRNDLYCVEWDVKLYYTILVWSLSIKRYKLYEHTRKPTPKPRPL